jgi:O-antigen/teichoic acid export membrane protein
MSDRGAGSVGRVTSVPASLSRIARLSAAFVCSNLARAAIGLALSLVLGRGLGATRFGGWILCTMWASMLTVAADLGFGVLLARDGARADAEPGRLLIAALVVRLLFASFLACALAAAAPALTANPELVAGLRVASLLGVAGAAYGCFGSLLRSQPRWLPAVLGVETGWLAIQVGTSWWVLHVGGGIAALLGVAIATQAAEIATAIVLWRPVFGDRGAPRRARPAELRTTLGRAWPFAVTGLVANVQARVAPLMLGYLAPPIELGWFGAALRVAGVAKLAPSAIFAGALPVLSHEYVRDRGEAHRVSRTLDRLLLAAAACGVAGSLVFAAPLMRLIFGPSFGAAAPSLVWVAIGLVPALSNSSRKIFLYAAGREAAVVGWSLVAVTVEILAAIALIPIAGSTGAAISVAFGEAAIWMPLRRAAEPDAQRDASPITAAANFEELVSKST